jgi:rhodanese-related sulfurtransferase
MHYDLNNNGGYMNKKLIATAMLLAFLLLFYWLSRVDWNRDKNSDDIQATPAAAVEAPASQAQTAQSEKGAATADNYDRLFKAVEKKEEIPVINLAAARVLYENKKVLFVDARSGIDYRDAHISGALLITSGTPVQDIEKLKNQLKDRLLVTYCSGESCHMAEETAKSLYDAGYRKIAVFSGGWSEWTAAGLPEDDYEPLPEYRHLFSDMVPEKGPVEITLKEAKFLFDNSLANFIDIDTLEEFNKFRIDRAYSMPADKIGDMMPGFKNIMKNKPAIIYCRSGKIYSKKAAEAMYTAGHRQILIFDKGLLQWKEAGYPVYEAPVR